MVEASGTSVARTTTTMWEPNLHVPASVATQNLTTSYMYDAAGNPMVRTDTSPGGLSRTWTTVWANAQPMSITGPRTDIEQVTQFSYGNYGALSGIKDAAGHVTQIPQSTNGGLPLKQIDPNGVTTTYNYDARQRLLATNLATAAGVLTTSYMYDPAGNLTKKTLPDGSFDIMAFDPAHRLTADMNALGQTTSYMLDALGDRLMTTTANSTGKTTWQVADTFDALGRRTQEVKGAGQTSTYMYDPNSNLVMTVDGRSLPTVNTIDPLDRVAQVKDAANGLTMFSYDAHDRITKVAAPNGAVTSYTYDGFGRETMLTSPDTGTTTAKYDLADNVTSTTDGAGIVTNTKYDALNRPTNTLYPSDKAENVARTYDQTGHGFGFGRLTSLTDAAGTLSLSYDERGNRVSEARTSGTTTLTTAYAYDKASRPAGTAYPSETSTAYVYDLAGQAGSVTATLPGATQPVTLAASFAWKPFGPLSGVTYGNGIVETRGYDLAYRLGALVSGGVENLTYGYDGDDNATSIADGVTKANSQTLGYDSLNRLMSASGGYGAQSWKYDASGNRTQQVSAGVTTAYSYAPNSNVLTTAGKTAVAVNGIGSITGLTPASGNATTLGYNAAERLASEKIGSKAQLANTYDAFGRRTLKTAGKTSTQFLFDPAGDLLEERDTTGATLTRLDTVYLAGVPLADINPDTGAVFTLHTDHLGTPQVATTSQGAIARQGAYSPFGTVTAPKGLLTQNLRFPGQYADAPTGWNQNGFRDYDPDLGRYLESDPLGLVAGLNTFSYAKVNPLNSTDRLGQQAEPTPDSESKTLFEQQNPNALDYSTSIDPEEFSRSGREPDPTDQSGRMTHAGRALQKHGGRPGSSFMCPAGNPSVINQAGQDKLDDILTDPNSQAKPASGRFRGNGTDIIGPSGQGIRFDSSGNFVGFLEP